MPKSHRVAGPSQLRTHSRNSSATKLGTNLHFTHKDATALKHTGERSKKTGHGQDISHANTTAPLQRTSSAVRAHSKDHVQQIAPKRPPETTTRTNGKPKAGFTIASPGEDDDDEWVSSESGAVTPSQESDSDVDSAETQSRTPVDQVKPVLKPLRIDNCLEHQVYNGLKDTVHRQPETDAMSHVPTAPPVSSGIQETQTAQLDAAAAMMHRSTLPRHELREALPQPRPQSNDNDPTFDVRSEVASPTQIKSRPASKRWSGTRPPSMLSTTSRSEHSLRPHPLIRGQSYGQANYLPKPAPLAPLTVISDTPSTQAPGSPSLDGMNGKLSPTSMRTAVASPSPIHPSPSQHRRTSISSARSVSTLPVPATISQPRPTAVRTRTLSTLSSSSSSAALSSLAHLPTVSRPPTPQIVAFFPPQNPYVNLEVVHPLLPSPYLHSHMTVLARRIPLRESYDRVIYAKHAR